MRDQKKLNFTHLIIFHSIMFWELLSFNKYTNVLNHNFFLTTASIKRDKAYHQLFNIAYEVESIWRCRNEVYSTCHHWFWPFMVNFILDKFSRNNAPEAYTDVWNIKIKCKQFKWKWRDWNNDSNLYQRPINENQF